MFHNLNSLSAVPERLYHSSEEVRKDIGRIRAEMTRVDSMLSVHSLRVGILGECTVEELQRKIPELEAAVYDADKSLRLLVRFSAAVSELGRELDEVMCVLKE